MYQVLVADEAGVVTRPAPRLQQHFDGESLIGDVVGLVGVAGTPEAGVAALAVEGGDGGQHVAEVAHQVDLAALGEELAEDGLHAGEGKDLLDEAGGLLSRRRRGALVEVGDLAPGERGQSLRVPRRPAAGWACRGRG